MSFFSETLSSFIKDKNADVPKMCIYCNIDRSNMYKILRGTRNAPSLVTLNRIREFLRLTPSEWQILNNAWHLTVLGSKTFYRRKSVEHFLLSFPETFSSSWNPEAVYGSGDPAEPDFLCAAPSSLALETRMDVNTFLLQMLSREAYREFGNISVLVQPDYDFLFHALTGLMPPNTLTVEHVFCLSNIEELYIDHQIRHMQYLENIFPLFVTSNLEYNPLYYYGDIPTLFNDFSLFSCMIMTSEFVMLCTPDFQQGVFFNDSKILSFMKNSFCHLKERCESLFRTISVNLADFEQYRPIRTLVRPDIHTYIIQEEGCLLPLISAEIMEEFLAPSLPDRDSIIKVYTANDEDAQAEMADRGETWLHQFFTKNGLLYFVRTGLFRELPPQFCKPLSAKSRISLLKAFQKFCFNGMFRMLKAPLENISGNLRLVVSERLGYLVLSRENMPLTYLLFNEPYYLGIFSDYMQSLENYCYSIEDTVDCIQDLIDSL